MQDYAKLYQKDRRSRSKMNQIRRLLLLKLPPEVIVVLIAIVVFPLHALSMIRR
jgi:hypothetical protein